MKFLILIMKKEVKKNQNLNGLKEKYSKPDKLRLDNMKMLHNRKLSSNAEHRYKKIPVYQSVSSKRENIIDKAGKNVAEGGFKMPKKSKTSLKYEKTPHLLEGSTYNNEEKKQLKEIKKLVKQINSKLWNSENKQDLGVQTSGCYYTPKHPSTLTIKSILKEVAINDLFRIKPQLFENLLKNADSDLKRFLLSRIVYQYQYQSVVEELLSELKDQGLDAEAYIYEAYKSLGIQEKITPASSERLIIDTDATETIESMQIDLDNIN